MSMAALDTREPTGGAVSVKVKIWQANHYLETGIGYIPTDIFVKIKVTPVWPLPKEWYDCHIKGRD